jgi:hypothetical protein
MKMKNYKQFSLIALVMLLAFSLTSCDIKNPVEGLKVIINAAKVSTIISVDIVDAKTGEQIGINGSKHEVTLKVLGTHKDYIVDIIGNKKSEFKTEVGIMNFALSESFKPGVGNMLDVILVVNSEGYLPTSHPLQLASEGGHSVVIRMVKRSNLPTGVVSSSKTSTSVAGFVSTPITVTASEPSSKGSATLSVPAGVQVFDGNGNPVSGTLTANVTYFNNQNEGSLSSFPGGFMVNTGTNGRGLFTTGGFASFEITNGSGTNVKTFSDPINVSMQVPGNTINPETGAAIAGGDIIPVWSYNELTGTWAFEYNGTAVGPNPDGTYTIAFTTTHLSWWNIDWFNGNFCQNGITINVTGNFTSLNLRAKRVDTGEYFYYGGYVSSSYPSVQILNAPSNMPSIIEAYDCNGVVGSVQVSDLCGTSVNLPVTASAGTNVSVTVSGYCANTPDVTIRPNISIYIKDQCGWSYGGYMLNGMITLQNLVMGQTYTFGVWYDNNWYEHEYTVTQASYNYDFEFPAELCN